MARVSVPGPAGPRPRATGLALGRSRLAALARAAFGFAWAQAFCYFGNKTSMCRNIKPLFNFDPPVTDEEIRAAALQFVRKISGYTKPPKANETAFAGTV